MNKTYISPVVEITEIEVEQMLAVSLDVDNNSQDGIIGDVKTESGIENLWTE